MLMNAQLAILKQYSWNSTNEKISNLGKYRIFCPKVGLCERDNCLYKVLHRTEDFIFLSCLKLHTIHIYTCIYLFLRSPWNNIEGSETTGSVCVCVCVCMCARERVRESHQSVNPSELQTKKRKDQNTSARQALVSQIKLIILWRIEQ